MIYNLKEYVKAQFPAYAYAVDGFLDGSPNNCIAIIDSGGSDSHYDIRSDSRVQFSSRSEDKSIARLQAQNIYSLLKNRIGLTLPESVVGSTTYPELFTDRIVPIQMPEYMGAENGRHIYIFNLIVTIGG